MCGTFGTKLSLLSHQKRPCTTSVCIKHHNIDFGRLFRPFSTNQMLQTWPAIIRCKFLVSLVSKFSLLTSSKLRSTPKIWLYPLFILFWQALLVLQKVCQSKLILLSFAFLCLHNCRNQSQRRQIFIHLWLRCQSSIRISQ